MHFLNFVGKASSCCLRQHLQVGWPRMPPAVTRQYIRQPEVYSLAQGGRRQMFWEPREGLRGKARGKEEGGTGALGPPVPRGDTGSLQTRCQLLQTSHFPFSYCWSVDRGGSDHRNRIECWQVFRGQPAQSYPLLWQGTGKVQGEQSAGNCEQSAGSCEQIVGNSSK